MTTPDGMKTLKCILLLSAVDLPARAMLLSMKQFNGIKGCSFCYYPGQSALGSPLHRFWPPQSSVILRTHDSMCKDAQEAVESNVPVCDMISHCAVCMYVIRVSYRILS